MNHHLKIQRIASKWEKTKVLQLNKQIRPYIPETRLYAPDQIEPMLDAHGLTYLKPDRGTYGHGVMNLQRIPIEEDGIHTLKLRSGIQSDSFASMEQLITILKERIGERPYLIQQGIQLLTYENRGFDLRVLVQKNRKDIWETTGYIGRVAAIQKIVTNHHSGGTALPLEELLGSHVNYQEMARIIRELRKLGEQVGAQLEKRYPRLKEIGLDVAIDPQFHLWILEVNTLPALFPFKWLNDKSIYKRIRKYAIGYGRLRPDKKRTS